MMTLKDVKGQSLRSHLTEFHGQEAAVVAQKDDNALDLFHFMQHDHMRLGRAVSAGTRAHTHQGMH